MKSHVAEIVLGTILSGVICYIVLVVFTNAVKIDEWICCALMITANVATAAALLRSYAEEDKKEILEEIRRSRGE